MEERGGGERETISPFLNPFRCLQRSHCIGGCIISMYISAFFNFENQVVMHKNKILY